MQVSFCSFICSYSIHALYRNKRLIQYAIGQDETQAQGICGRVSLGWKPCMYVLSLSLIPTPHHNIFFTL